jgi:hypothetical protein
MPLRMLGDFPIDHLSDTCIPECNPLHRGGEWLAKIFIAYWQDVAY